MIRLICSQCAPLVMLRIGCSLPRLDHWRLSTRCRMTSCWRHIRKDADGIAHRVVRWITQLLPPPHLGMDLSTARGRSRSRRFGARGTTAHNIGHHSINERSDRVRAYTWSSDRQEGQMTSSSPRSFQSERGYRQDPVGHDLVANVSPHHQESIDLVLAKQSPNFLVLASTSRQSHVGRSVRTYQALDLP